MSEIAGWIAQNRTLLIIVGVIALAFLLLRSTPSDIPDNDLLALTMAGEPVVVEFYSNT